MTADAIQGGLARGQVAETDRMYTSKTAAPDDWNDSSVADSVSFIPETDFVEVHELLRRAMRRFCGARWATHAEDFAQDAFARLFEKQQRGELPEPIPNSYVYRVAYNAWVDAMRKISRVKEVTAVSRGDFPNLPPVSDNPEGDQRMRETRAAIRECMRELPGDRRHVLELSALGHGRCEIATLLGLKIKRVDNSLHRGKLALLSCLEKKGHRP